MEQTWNVGNAEQRLETGGTSRNRGTPANRERRDGLDTTRTVAERLLTGERPEDGTSVKPATSGNRLDRWRTFVKAGFRLESGDASKSRARNR